MAPSGDRSRGGRARRTILVIDDSPIALASAQEVLERGGYRVLLRDDARAGLAVMIDEQPDLVLLDLQMPEVSGDTLIRLFGAACPSSETVILLYSALPETVTRQKARDVGAHGYLSKGASPVTLLSTIRRHLPAAPRAVSPAGYYSSGSGERSVAVSPVSSRASSGASSPASSGAFARHASGARVMDPRGMDPRGIIFPGEAPMRDARRPTVLLVDDEMLVLSAFRRQFQGDSIDFEFALSGRQALNYMRSDNPPQVVVSDVVMPEPNGVDVFCQALALDPRWEDRYVFFTGEASLARGRVRSHSKSVPILNKPVPVETLRELIHQRLRLAGGF